MESAENQDKSPQVNPIEESNDPSTLSRIETIKLLNDSIDKLESTIRDLSQNSVTNLPSTDSINALLSTTQELAQSVASPPPTPPSTAPVAESPPKTATPIVSPTTPTPIEPAENIPPAKIKATEESNGKTVAQNPKPENRGLRTIGIIAVAIAVIALIWLWFPEGATTTTNTSVSEPTTITTDTPVSEPTTTEIGDPQSKIESELETPLIPIVESGNDSDRLSEENTPVEVEIDSPEVISIPPALTAPGKAKNLKMDTIEPELTFTPEQTLIAALQDKLTELVSSYDSDLFDSVRVDVPTSSLLVEVTDKWYELNQSSQDKLANEILKRSRQLDFNKLQLQDSTGTLVARNPVIGDRAIIVQTSKNN